ncbi:hypothetical protein GCM10009754_53670 [Amycolatopsis minnesotensis]|uniref:HTH cro/C1-type domain-containing protein n=1 Tax=Amycolatopsis minnesotensis TaxID=337894 RepID=A0ABP5D157_9PSEU
MTGAGRCEKTPERIPHGLPMLTTDALMPVIRACAPKVAFGESDAANSPLARFARGASRAPLGWTSRGATEVGSPPVLLCAAMGMRESTATSRELGGELRRRRENAGMTGVDLARRTGWQQSKISRMEAGRGDFSDLTVNAYLAYCGVPVSEVAEIVRSAQGTTAYRARTTMLSNVIFHEQSARSITMVAPALIPGLLQTEEYTRAVMAASRRSPSPKSRSGSKFDRNANGCSGGGTHRGSPF